MTSKAQIPRIAEIIGPGLDKLAEVRPSAFKFANNGVGRYGDLFAGWSGQVALMIRRLADEVVSTRLALAEKSALTELASSDFETDRTPGPTFSVGFVSLIRTGTSGGAIPKGFKFRRQANPSALPPIAAASYEVTQDVPVGFGEGFFYVPIRATAAGAHANSPHIDGTNDLFADLSLDDVPFDTTIGVTGHEASGGSDGESDDDLRRQAAAFANGQYAPTRGAIIAGALRGTGVHRIASFEVSRLSTGQAAAFTGICIADQSWGSGSVWQAAVRQIIADTFLGFGCVVKVNGLSAVRIRVQASVTLQSSKDLTDTSAITQSIQDAVRAYFDDRPDWYTFRLSQLRGVISRADPKIQSCSSAIVFQLVDDTPIPDPPAPVARPNGVLCTHWMLTQNGVSVTFAAPV